MWTHLDTSSCRELPPIWRISWQQSAAARPVVGGAAVKAADEGDTGKMVVIDRVSDDPYMAATGIYDVHRIANEEKLVPRNWMNKDANNVTKDFIDYIKPLIQGDYQPIMVNGVPRHLVLNTGRKKKN